MSALHIRKKLGFGSSLAAWGRAAATTLVLAGAACDAETEPLANDITAAPLRYEDVFEKSAVATPERAPGLAMQHAPALPTSFKRMPPAPALMIVTEDALMPAAKAWATYRTGGGYKVEIRAASDLQKEAHTNRIPFDASVRKHLARMLDDTHADRMFLMLLGDAPGQIPAASCPNTTPGASGCWTDNVYGDLDGDGLPDVATGRVPAQSVDEALAVLAKIKDHETHYRVGLHNRRVSLYIGESGFGQGIDDLLESIMMQGLDLMSYDFDITGAWFNPASAYWFAPFSEKVVDFYNEGALMTVYIGHGSETWSQGLSSDDVDRVACDVRRPVSLFFACYAGAFVGDDDSLSETLLFKSNGPVAAYGASDVSHPFGNAILAYESQRVALDMAEPTLGETVMAFERALIENGDDEFRQMISGAAMIEGSTDSVAKQEALLREHVALYNLLGDPAMSMQYPRGKVLMSEPVVDAHANMIVVDGQVRGVRKGEAIVTLEVPRDVILGDLEDFDPWYPDLETIAANWETANDKIVVEIAVPVSDGRFHAVLAPADALSKRIAYHVKVYAHDDVNDAIGSIAVPRVQRD